MMESEYKIQRTLESAIRDCAPDFRSLLLTGPRQVGKSTLLKHLCEDGRKCITFDNELARNEAKEDPTLFFTNNKPPLLLDEVQRVPGLFLSIKEIIDRDGRKNLFWLTGSQKPQLMQKAGDSLAGRVLIVDMQGLSISERQGKCNGKPFLPSTDGVGETADLSIDDVLWMIFSGSYPEVQEMSEISRPLWYESYLKTYFEKDLAEYIKVSNIATFRRFLSILALHCGQELNYSDIARAIGVSSSTVEAWTSLLESFGIIYRLQTYASNRLKRLLKRSKLYFMDTGLCAHLAGIHSLEEFKSNSQLSGHLVESFVISEILKSWTNNLRTGSFYFYRDYDGNEIDLLIEDRGKLYPIEIKKNASPKKDMVKSFRFIPEDIRGEGALVCLHNRRELLTQDTMIVPISLI